jgi:hypothetical protein
MRLSGIDNPTKCHPADVPIDWNDWIDQETVWAIIRHSINVVAAAIAFVLVGILLGLVLSVRLPDPLLEGAITILEEFTLLSLSAFFVFQLFWELITALILKSRGIK